LVQVAEVLAQLALMVYRAARAVLAVQVFKLL
jgi:hypothetical protein